MRKKRVASAIAGLLVAGLSIPLTAAPALADEHGCSMRFIPVEAVVATCTNLPGVFRVRLKCAVSANLSYYKWGYWASGTGGMSLISCNYGDGRAAGATLEKILH